MASWWAIALWLRPSANNWWTWVALRRAAGGLPCGFPCWRACAMPARTRSRRISPSNSAGHGTACRCGQIESLRERHEPDAQLVELLQGQQQIGHRPTPPIQAPHENGVDVPSTGSRHQELSLRPLDGA